MVYIYTVGLEGSSQELKPKRKLKKAVWAALTLLILAVISFGGGIWIAEKFPQLNNYFKFRAELKESRTVIINTDLPSIIPEIEKDPTSEPAVEDKKTEIDQSQQDIPEPVKFSFAVVGDTQYFKAGSNGSFQKAAANIKKMNVDIVMSVGDLVSSCSGSACAGKLNSWKSVWGNLASKTYPTQGNHDRTGGKSADGAWQSVFNLPTNGPEGYSELVYSFDFQNSHFVVLDSDNPEEHLINGEQRAWLERDLTANKKENTFVFFHEPAYPVSSKISESLDVKSGDRNALWNILTAHKVTAVFNGHEHIHNRRKINGIYQFVFGNTNAFNHDMPSPGVAEYAYQGENFGIVRIEDKKITVEVYTIGGKLLDSFTFSI
jgi:predicted phosphodiesterase